VTCFGWSAVSEAEAQQQGLERATRHAERLAAGEALEGGYSYSSNPLREETLKEFPSVDGTPFAVVTRNGYGCLVLNTARVMFVDVDLPPKTASEALGRFFKSLLGKHDPYPRGKGEASRLALVQKALRADASLGIRVYQTASGLRYLITSHLADPESDAAQKEMIALAVDPAYLKLCKVQKSFRARLSPKPWRVGVPRPPHRWPFANAGEEQAFQNWQAKYLKGCEGKAVCLLLKEYGTPVPAPEIAQVISFHDKMTGALGLLPLA